MLKVGFTGTRIGLTFVQFDALVRSFDHFVGEEQVNLFIGGAEGADEQVFNWALGWPSVEYIAIFPATGRIPSYGMSFCTQDPKPPLDRNRDIVSRVDYLFVAPSGMVEERRSGTWATYRYAKKKGIARWIVWPNGEVSFEGRSSTGDCAERHPDGT